MAQPEISDLIKNIQADVTTIVKGEVELAKAELLPQAKSLGIGAGMFGGAGFLAATAGSLLLISLSVGFAEGYRSWFALAEFAALALGFLTTAVLLLIGAGVLAVLGKNKVSVTGPKATIEQGQQSVTAVMTALERGTDDAVREAADRKAARRTGPSITAAPAAGD